MSENKIAKVPVASHGVHKHSYNYPWLSSINFGDVMPCYINTLRKGERDSPKGGVYSQLMPIAHNAFATGRFNFKAIFVPYKLVWRPWYFFAQQTEMNNNGEFYTPTRYPFLSHTVLSNELVHDLDLFTLEGADHTHYDVLFYVPNDVSPFRYYLATPLGAKVLRILGALGCMPSFVDKDMQTINILAILCYVKAYADYYFPSNYIGGTVYRQLSQCFDRDYISFDNIVTGIVAALKVCSVNFYENSLFDLAWDNPATPNVASGVPSVQIPDVSNDSEFPMIVTNSGDNIGTPNASNVVPTNGIPFVAGSKTTAAVVSSSSGVVTKYVLDSLKSLSLWAKRHQLAGARLLDRFLVSRGFSLSNDSARMSYFVGQRNVEIEVSGVENNTDVNLGELAGRGIASSGKDPLQFECRPDDDGIFLVLVSPLPDANFPVLLDGFSVRRDFMDNYNAEFDKLGNAAVPSRVINQGLDGHRNYDEDPDGESVFGFLNQYWDEVQERPRLLGDFILKSRGAEELSAYHTFRLFNHLDARHHSYNFIRMDDWNQYNRLFYSEKQENLMLFIRWFGNQYKEKLPLGDSYDWDDDDLNRKVSVVVGGSQK